MFNEYEYEYDNIIEDTEELYDDDDDYYMDDEDAINTSDWENYYHNIVDEIIDD